jgi:hypothetical protein
MSSPLRLVGLQIGQNLSMFRCRPALEGFKVFHSYTNGWRSPIVPLPSVLRVKDGDDSLPCNIHTRSWAERGLHDFACLR